MTKIESVLAKELERERQRSHDLGNEVMKLRYEIERLKGLKEQKQIEKETNHHRKIRRNEN